MSLDDIPHCDVFFPNEEEFKNFEKYVSKCEKQAKSGIIKVYFKKFIIFSNFRIIRLFLLALGKQEKITMPIWNSRFLIL